MKLLDLTCPNCSAVFKVDTEQKKCVCEYCGTQFLIDDETKHIKLDNGYEFGYSIEQGRIQAKYDTITKLKELEHKNKSEKEKEEFYRVINTPIAQYIKRKQRVRSDSALYSMVMCELPYNYNLQDQYRNKEVSIIAKIRNGKPRWFKWLFDSILFYYINIIISIIIIILIFGFR